MVQASVQSLPGFETVWSKQHPVEDENRGDAVATHLEVVLPLWPFDDTVLCAIFGVAVSSSGYWKRSKHLFQAAQRSQGREQDSALMYNSC